LKRTVQKKTAPKQKSLPVKWIVLSILLMAVFAMLFSAWYVLLHDRGLNRKIDAERLAAAETRMWQAYYGQLPQVSLGRELLALLREQFGLSYRSAYKVARELASATLKFRETRDDYEAAVLPDLVKAYTTLRDATDGDWNPEDVARAELEWWVARRTPGLRSPEQVGASIAKEYALFYGRSNPDIDQAGLLRAQAAALRDQSGPNTDWSRIQEMLTESYGALARGVR